MLERLRERLDKCIGCGCLSLRVCHIVNPDDTAATTGTGPRYVLGDWRVRGRCGVVVAVALLLTACDSGGGAEPGSGPTSALAAMSTVSATDGMPAPTTPAADHRGADHRGADHRRAGSA